MSAVALAVLAAVLVVLTLGGLAGCVAALAASRARGRLVAGGVAGGTGWWRVLDREVLDRKVPGRLVTALDDAALPVPPRRAWSLWVVGGWSVAATAALVGGPGAVVVVGAAWVVFPGVALALRRGAAGRAVDAALPHALEGVARSLRSGAGTHQALSDVAERTEGPLGDELGRVSAELSLGHSLERTLTAFEERRPEPGVRLAVAALLLGAEAGGAHARALDGVAEGVRARLAVGAEVKALASQAQLSALVIAAAPLAFAALAAGADGATASFLLGTPLGLACLAGGLLLDGVGALWMHRIRPGGAMSPTAATLAVAWAALAVAGLWPHRPAPRRVRRQVPDIATGSGRGPAAAVGAVALVVVARCTGNAGLAERHDPARVGRALLAAMAVGAVLPPAAPGVAAVVWSVPVLRSRRERLRRTAAIRRQLPEVVDLLVLVTGAGFTVPLAVEAVARRAGGPIGAELAVVVAASAGGRRLGDALGELPARLGEPVRPLVAALAGSERDGSPLGPSLERLAVELRHDRRRHAEAAARRVPVKLLFPLVTCILPAFALLTVAPLIAGAISALRP